MTTTYGTVRQRSSRGLYYERRGDGRPIVLIHGWCLSRELWVYAEEALVADHDVTSIDLPGFGGSAELAGPYTISRYADELGALIAELALTDSVAVGFAFGAAVAMSAAVKRVDGLGAVVAVGAPSAAHSPYERMPKAMRRDWPGFAAASGRAICRQPQSEATLEWLGRMFGATPLRSALQTVDEMTRFEPVELAPDVGVPTLYVHGADDDVVPLEISRECAEAAGTSELAVVPECGHLVPIDQKEPFHELVREFAGRATNEEGR